MLYRWLFAACLAALATTPEVQAQEAELQKWLFAIDANTSQILRFDLETETEAGSFATPVLCEPEGACGLVFTGYSLLMVDATDRTRRVYEMNPADGTIWHSFPAPADAVDGLAFADGSLYALSFVENRIYRLSLFDGEPLEVLEMETEVTGGLAAGEGRLFASRIVPLEAPEVLEIDPQSGAVMQRLETPSVFPAGLAFLDGRLYVSDPEEGLVHLVAPDGGALPRDWRLSLDRLVGLAAGRGLSSPPYALRLEKIAQEAVGDGEIEFVLEVRMVDGQERVLGTNDLTAVDFDLIAGEGELLEISRQQVKGGRAGMRVGLAAGTRGVVEARVSGLEPVRLQLGQVLQAAEISLELNRRDAEPEFVEVEARLLDALGGVATEDSSAVEFTVVGGRSALVGPAVATAREGIARTLVLLVGERQEIEVEARTGQLMAGAVLELEKSSAAAPEQGGLETSGQRTAGRDDLSPAPPAQVRTEPGENQVEVRWALSEDDGEARWFAHGEQMVRRQGIVEYLVFRSEDGGLFVEIGRLPPGSDRLVDAAVEQGMVYQYKVLAGDADNLSERLIAPGSEEDLLRTVRTGLPRDADGQVVQGLFNDDEVVDFEDFFLFADNFGLREEDAAFDARYDLDGNGQVDFDDFFIFADNFGRAVVAYF